MSNLDRPRRVAIATIGSVSNLCAALDITQSELDEALSLSDSEKYKAKGIPKSDGTIRIVHKPDRLIRKIQRRINKRMFSDPSVISWPEFLYGSLPNQYINGVSYPKDYVACAARHCGAKSLVKLDIRDFFGNVGSEIVLNIFTELFKYPIEVAKVLTQICCFCGALAQGGLTSSYLASLCLHDVEHVVVGRLNKKQLIYTRYVDDITVSSKFERYSFEYAINLIRQMLESKDLPLNETKTQVQRMSSESLVVHGLRVSFDQPRLPANEVSRIRAAVHNVESLAEESNYRTSHSYRKDYNRCLGRVNKLGRVGHKQHGVLVKRLNKILPLPSPKDIERITVMVCKLENDYQSKNSTFWYKRRFYLAHERLNVLQRTFQAAASSLRARLKPITPNYD